MLYEIFWKKKASKQLFKLETVTQKRIMKSVGELKDSKTWKNVKSLIKHQYTHRLRIGDYRVLFDADVSPKFTINEIRILNIQEVKKRDDRTY